MPEQQPRGQGGNASIYMPYGASGGGGVGEDYVFTDLDEIDGIITDLDAIRADIRDDDWYFDQAIALATPPADDVMSRGQVDAYHDSLQVGRDHNQMVSAYAEDQLAKLRAARQTYFDKDSGAADRLRGIDEAGR